MTNDHQDGDARLTEQVVASFDGTPNPRLRVLMQRLVRQVPVADHVQDLTVRVLQATHPDGPDAPALVKQYVRFGASPRGAQAVLLAAKIRALFDGRFAASGDYVRAMALPALRHRVLLNFEGEAEGIRSDQVIEQITKSLPEGKR